jgi:hypothetical protein
MYDDEQQLIVFGAAGSGLLQGEQLWNLQVRGVGRGAL